MTDMSAVALAAKAALVVVWMGFAAGLLLSKLGAPVALFYAVGIAWIAVFTFRFGPFLAAELPRRWSSGRG
jgi:hypothetical protein